MKKKFYFLALISLFFMVSVGCNKKKSTDNATSTQCLQDPYYGGCNNTEYNKYQAYGYQAYPYEGYSNSTNSIYRYQTEYYYGLNYGLSGSSLCGCPNGTRPVYNGNMGTGCVNQNLVPQYSRTYYWSWSAGNPQNNHYVNWGQMSNISGQFSNTGSGCYSNVAWSCLVNRGNQCPSGSTCRATAQNSPIGVCIQ
jgi:hypothetical protein